MAERIRDYKKEVEQRKARKEAKKAAGHTSSAPAEQPPPKKAAPVKKQSEPVFFMPTDCGHIPVPLSQIVSDPDQPRKFFDTVKLLELSKSIIQHDVIEPILIRPIAGGLYMVVFGERRFRGSLMAAEAGHPITHIPAMIKELTDAEALELQLVENLHRTDPHPIEDAFTFKKMLEKHPIEEISLRVGKSTKFVAMRIMLTDLIQPFQDVFFANKMSLGQAVLLCKVSAEAQAAIFADEVPVNWKEDEDFQLDDIKRLVNNESKNLDSAIFKTEDPDLYPEMGVCGKCNFNSANSLQLFVEQQASRICGNAVCFNIKCVRAYKANIENVMTDPTIVFVAGSHYQEEQKQKVKDVKALGAGVLDYGTWRKVSVMDKPILEQWIADNEDNFSPEDESREEFEARMKVEWEEGMKEWEEEQNEIATARADGKIRKAFIVAGADEGKFVEVIATTPQAELMLTGTVSAETAINEKIEAANQKEERKKELDAEHIWTEVRSQMLVGDHFNRSKMLNSVEQSALATAIYSSLEWDKKKAFAIEILKVDDYDDQVEMMKAFRRINTEQINSLYRVFLGSKLFPLPGSHLKNYVNAAGFTLAKSFIPETVANIEAEQHAKAAKRAEALKKTIEKIKEGTEE